MSHTPKHPFKSFMPNTKGTDYFVGDIHGNFVGLGIKLTEIDFNPNVDRLICVGDLVDRGDDSDMVEEWLKQPWFITVRGNHENLFLKWRSFKNNRSAQKEFEEKYYWGNGGRWVMDVEEELLQRIENRFAELPYFIALGTSDGKTIGVVHAELPDHSSWPNIIQIDDEKTFYNMVNSRVRLKSARGRSLNKGEYPPTDNNFISGLDVLVVGHMPVDKPQILGNIVYIDTRGWKSTGYFTLIPANELIKKIQSN